MIYIILGAIWWILGVIRVIVAIIDTEQQLTIEDILYFILLGLLGLFVAFQSIYTILHNHFVLNHIIWKKKK